MIASLGGAEVSSSGARNYPGSGGMVGGLSFEGGNWAYWGGAGKMYNRFTPSYAPQQPNNMVPIEPTVPEEPEPLPPCAPFCWTPTTPLPPETPTTPNTPSPTEVPTGGTFDCVQDCDSPTEIPTQTPAGILSYIQALLAGAPRTAVQSIPPLFSFAPPTASNGGLPMQQLLIVGALIFGAYFLYKKYS
jgi:hypothetical protein